MGGNEDDAGRFEKGIRWKWRQLDPAMGETLLELRRDRRDRMPVICLCSGPPDPSPAEKRAEAPDLVTIPSNAVASLFPAVRWCKL
jgi:hypothetical protein